MKFRWFHDVEFRKSPGFTLLEALVALSVTATVLASIAGLVNVNVRSTRWATERLSLIETARAILAGLPDRLDLKTTVLTGVRADHDWRVDVKPFGSAADRLRDSSWAPYAVTIQVRSPGGQVLRLDTVRLRGAGAAQ